MEQSSLKISHRGRFGQIPIYLGKFFRMFIYANDWKVLPMAGIIAALVAKVAAVNMFKTQEGTTFGALALSCICIWNGCFNSIQVVCRERDIVKREHRDGMHISSYIMSHMLYQGFLCACQAAITVVVCHIAELSLPAEGFITPWFNVDFFITLFLITYAADMLALMISSIVRTTTGAMTAMPFVLIFELLFSGSMFALSGFAERLTNLSVAKWGINALCAQAKFNELPMVTIWNKLKTFSDVSIEGMNPVKDMVEFVNMTGSAGEVTMWMGEHNQNVNYALTTDNIWASWLNLFFFAILFAILSVIFLEKIDKDKR